MVEYTGQVRAWFYVMHVISNALLGSHCFKNVVVTGVMMGTDGRKMSKSYGNYPDPKDILEKHGGDALRLYLMSSPIMVGESVKMTKGDEIEEQVKKVLLILWNSYRYFLTYTNSNKVSLSKLTDLSFLDSSKKNVMDEWLLSILENFVLNFSNYLENYQIPQAIKLIQPFVNELSTWYIRRSRNRFVSGDIEAYQTFYYVLKRFLLAVAPAIPFISEKIYQNIKNYDDPESVHLCDYPKPEKVLINKQLIEKMNFVRELVQKAHAIRKETGIKLRQPLRTLTITTPKRELLKSETGLIQIMKDELNVKEVSLLSGKKDRVKLDTKLTSKLEKEGQAREIIRQLQAARKKDECDLDQVVTAYAPSWPKEFEQEIKSKALVSNLLKGEEIKIVK
ncbi:class I tRNA ligase family protein [Patescibacteria group bacterium]